MLGQVRIQRQRQKRHHHRKVVAVITTFIFYEKNGPFEGMQTPSLRTPVKEMSLWKAIKRGGGEGYY